jgi:hypothetical protein
LDATVYRCVSVLGVYMSAKDLLELGAQAEVRKYEGFTEMLKAMRHEVDESEAKVAQERSPKKAHKSNK